ncbi:hypothetical protein SLA2020_473420 [Shorea laevis]
MLHSAENRDLGTSMAGLQWIPSKAQSDGSLLSLSVLDPQQRLLMLVMKSSGLCGPQIAESTSSLIGHFFPTLCGRVSFFPKVVIINLQLRHGMVQGDKNRGQ